MKKWMPAFLLLLALCAAACDRDCMDAKDVRIYKVSPALDAWTSDSMLLGFDMVRSDGIGDHFKSRPGYQNVLITGVSCQPRPEIRTEIEYRSFLLNSNLMEREIFFNFGAGPGGQVIGVSVGEFAGNYNIETGAFLSSNTTEGIITCTGSTLDSLDVRGRVWRDVLNMRTTAGFVDIQEIWMARGWGLIRYRETNGQIWERLP